MNTHHAPVEEKVVALDQTAAFVMPGRVPGIHVWAAREKEDVDGRDEARP